MSSFARAALARIEGFLPLLRKGASPLRPRLVLAEDGESEDDEIVFEAEDGRRHLVRVQVGTAYLSANSDFYAIEDLGEDLALARFDSMRTGPMRRNAATGAFRDDLRKAFEEQPEAFEPRSAPGVGTHPLLTEMLVHAREALAGTDVTIALNPDGPAGEDDVLAFSGADGERLPVEARTAQGGYRLVETGTGTAIASYERRRAEAFVEALRAAAPAAPAPGR